MTSILNLTPEVRVNTTTASPQYEGHVAVLTDGSYIVTWISGGQDGDTGGIYFQRYDANGAKIGVETRVNTTTAGNQIDPDIVAGNDGGFIITWYGAGTGDADGIFFQRYNSSAAKIGTETLVNTTTASFQSVPSIAMLIGGGFVITWHSNLQDGSNYGIYMQRYNSAGTAQGSETQVNVTTTGQQYFADVATLADGSYVVTWQSDGQDGDGGGVYARHYSATGVALSGELHVSTTSTGHQSTPAITALGDGGYVIAWQGNGPGDGDGVFFQRYYASDLKAGGETRVAETIGGNIYAEIKALNDGGFVVGWTAPDADGYGIYTRRFDNLGYAVGPQTLVNAYTASAEEQPDMAALPGGGYITVWESNGEDGSFDGVYSRSFVTAPNLVGTQYLYGTADADVLDGGSGWDQMYGGMGNDVYYVNAQNDTVVEQPGEGHDLIVSSSDQYFMGTDVEDLTLTGSAEAGYGNDADNIMTGNAGNNILEGYGGKDVLSGGDGNDTLYGDWDDDVLEGGSGNDSLYGGYGINTLEGEDGDDTIYAYPRSVDARQPNLPAPFDYVTGGHGYDTYDAGRAGPVDINLVTGKVYSQGVRIAQLAEIEILAGSGFADRLIGDTGFNQLYGGSGDDTLDGNAGDDDLFGEDGQDTASYLSANAAVTVSLLLQDQDQDTGGNGTDYLDSIENLTGSRFTDTLTGDDNANVLNGSTGADKMSGGLGNDTYYVDNAGDVVTELGGQGTDTVVSTLTYTLAPPLENLTLTGTAAINGTGNNAANIITGNDGVNVLDGGAGPDTISGGAGTDTIRGNAGADTLTGGADADTFVFEKFGAALNGTDHLTDFVSGFDKLSFTAADYGFTAGHVLTAAEYHVNPVAGSNGQFIYNTANHGLYWDPDGPGATAATIIVIFDNNAQPVAGDFVFT